MNGLIAIVCDNWKLTKFKEELDKKNFAYTVHPFTADTTVLKVASYDQQAIKTLAFSVEDHFNNKKAKNN